MADVQANTQALAAGLGKVRFEAKNLVTFVMADQAQGALSEDVLGERWRWGVRRNIKANVGLGRR